MQEDSETFRISLRAGFWAGILMLVLFLTLFMETVSNQSLANLGNYPKTWLGIVGIFVSPLIHSNFNHLLGNLLPVCGGFFLVGLLYPDIALRVLSIIWIATGILVWFTGRPAYHIGSSGVGYGLISFLFFIGLLRKDRSAMVISLLVLLTQSTMIIGWLPLDYKVSYESHAAGIVVGTFTALIYFNRYPRQNINISTDLVDFPEEVVPIYPKVVVTPKELGTSYSVQNEDNELMVKHKTEDLA
ncbi:MAG: rhomboid family intramembrane serine protease [Bacteroidia bacterium]|nr:rhomboid family intramembrane serine protease [Bacteroidia bacterium]